MNFIHLSDLHAHHEDVNNEKLASRIEALKKIEEKDSPDTFFLTGDLTDDGRPDQRDKLKALLDSLARQMITIPGNHDYGTLGSAYEEDRAKAFDDLSKYYGNGPFFFKIPVQVRTGNVLFILLNSCLETESPTDFACGKIGVGQLGLLDRILRKSDGLVKIVCLHHHPIWHSDPTMKLLDGDLFMKTISGRVDVLCFGHRHVYGRYDGQYGIKFILAAPALFETTFVDRVVVENGKVSVETVQLEV